MKIEITLVISEKGNQVVKAILDNSSYIETLYGWKGYQRLKQLENLVDKNDIKHYRSLLDLTNKLYSDKTELGNNI